MIYVNLHIIALQDTFTKMNNLCVILVLFYVLLALIIHFASLVKPLNKIFKIFVLALQDIILRKENVKVILKKKLLNK